MGNGHDDLGLERQRDQIGSNWQLGQSEFAPPIFEQATNRSWILRLRDDNANTRMRRAEGADPTGKRFDSEGRESCQIESTVVEAPNGTRSCASRGCGWASPVGIGVPLAAA